jgi:hypothetical protein
VKPGPSPIPRPPDAPPKPPIPDDQEIFVDLSPNFNSIRSQDGIGACTAFAATSIFEYIMHTGYSQPKTYLSPLYLYYRSREAVHEENLDQGAYPDSPLYILTNHGVCFENVWRFEPRPSEKFRQRPDEAATGDAAGKRVIQYMGLPRNDPDQWVHELLAKNPVYMGISVPDDFDNYRGRLYQNFHPSVSRTSGHAMVIVGYHSHYPYDGRGIKAFKLRNSWDVTWGENGYVWMPAEILVALMNSSPSVLRGWKRERQANYKIIGRVIFDNDYDESLSGAELYSRADVTNPVPEDDHVFFAGAFAQMAGNIVKLVEIEVKDKRARFELNFEADAAAFEKLTELPKRFPVLKGIDFTKLAPGIVVYKRTKGEEEYFFHTTDFKYSKAGRGGEGIHNHPDNPCSSLLNQELKHSGVPIILSERHNTEENVIVPVMPYEEEIERELLTLEKFMEKLKQHLEKYPDVDKKNTKDLLEFMKNVYLDVKAVDPKEKFVIKKVKKEIDELAKLLVEALDILHQNHFFKNVKQEELSKHDKDVKELNELVKSLKHHLREITKIDEMKDFEHLKQAFENFFNGFLQLLRKVEDLHGKLQR